MASAWAQLSKDEQAYWSSQGMTKPEYNAKYGKGGTTAPSVPTDWGDGNTLTGPIGNPETPTAGKLQQLIKQQKGQKNGQI